MSTAQCLGNESIMRDKQMMHPLVVDHQQCGAADVPDRYRNAQR